MPSCAQKMRSVEWSAVGPRMILSADSRSLRVIVVDGVCAVGVGGPFGEAIAVLDVRVRRGSSGGGVDGGKRTVCSTSEILEGSKEWVVCVCVCVRVVRVRSKRGDFKVEIRIAEVV